MHDLATWELSTSNVLFGDCNTESATEEGALW